MTLFDEDLRDTTRDLRRTLHLAESLELVAADVQLALAAERDPQRALRAALHRHLGTAFDAGAGHSADLQSALDAARAQLERLKRINRELQRRVSADR